MPSPSDFRKAFGLEVGAKLGTKFEITSSHLGHEVKVGTVKLHAVGGGAGLISRSATHILGMRSERCVRRSACILGWGLLWGHHQ